VVEGSGDADGSLEEALRKRRVFTGVSLEFGAARFWSSKN
jgi:hypothetical protein